ncbi:MAG: hypothetical protein QNJ81_07360 [Acidimicrobiia bacterium]|nr:hypothetical protein [Acidimicrobiia bacterium]
MKKKMIGLALAIGAAAVVAKLIGAKKAEWQGLSEAQVREKVEQRMPSRVPAEKREEVADKVVTAMRDRGVLVEDEAEVEESAPADEAEPSEPSSEEPAPADESEAAEPEADETEEPAQG